METREVVLIGGEAYLHPGFIEVVRAIADAGMRVGMTTGGMGITADLARAMADAGMYNASVSIDGLAETHDRMRSRRGSFEAATDALGHLAAAGIRICANTNINRLNEADLEGLYDHLHARGVKAWQVQLTAALGRAADRPEMLLQPFEMAQVMPRIEALKKRGFEEGLAIMPGNNLGYFGPEEALLRSPRKGMRDHWAGCQAGRFVMGIESNGAIKGCPSLQASYIGGNVRDRSLNDLWKRSTEIRKLRARTQKELWGFCRTCPFAEPCRGGCTFTSHALFGRAGNNPYCHYRVRALAERGIRERLVATTPAPGQPFDCGRFELVEESLDGPLPPRLADAQLVQIRLDVRGRKRRQLATAQESPQG
jgi:radical SAM protein with 4Fe4S-binding SPASM domain